jgi:HPt (histidine-containing phosphotransfer) domain-containing protein
MSPNDPNASDRIYSELASDDSMLELVEMFVEEIPDRVKSLQDALNAENYEGLKHLAHQLKGAAGGYGFHDITEPSRALEISSEANLDNPTLIRQDAETLIGFLNRMTAAPDPNET